MSANDDLDAAALDDFDDLELVNEKPLTWFDVSAIGTGEMLFTAGWAWIVFIASSYGIKWTLIGFFGGVAGHPHRLVAVPGDDHRGPRAGVAAVLRPRSRGVLARHLYLILYAPVYGGFMWLELIVARGLLETLIPAVAALDVALHRPAAGARA